MSLQFKIKKEETHVKLYEESLRTVPKIAMLKMCPAREGLCGGNKCPDSTPVSVVHV